MSNNKLTIDGIGFKTTDSGLLTEIENHVMWADSVKIHIHDNVVSIDMQNDGQYTANARMDAKRHVGKMLANFVRHGGIDAEIKEY